MRRRVVQLAVAVVVATAGVSGTNGAAGAAEIPVSGPLVAQGAFESTADCPAFHTWHFGDADWTGLGAVSFRLDYCVELRFLPEPSSPLSGTFTIDAADGGLTGDVVGEISNISGTGEYPADYVLTITGGTGAYERATGTLVIDGAWTYPGAPVLRLEGTVAGSVVVPPPTPTGPGDCRHGGWRHLADDHGRPFRNQGHCIAWAIHHT